MERLIIEINDSTKKHSNLENKVEITKNTYRNFIKIAKEINAFKHIRENTLLECVICKSLYYRRLIPI